MGDLIMKYGGSTGTFKFSVLPPELNLVKFNLNFLYARNRTFKFEFAAGQTD